MIMYGYHTNSPEQFDFTTKDNNLYYPQAVNDWLNWIYKKSPMDLQITPHGFRHPHCSLLFEIGASIKETGDRFAKFMGM